MTKCAPDGVGGTNVECTWNDAPIAPFVLPLDVSIVGFDQLKEKIEFMVSECIADALREAQ